jgi:acetolactate synthase small subunit
MQKQEYTITVYTENQIGLINRIAILFSKRKINIESLNTSPSEVEGIHRFTIVINETEEVVRKLCRQLEKQVEILKAYYNTNEEIIWQELALYKVSHRRDRRKGKSGKTAPRIRRPRRRDPQGLSPYSKPPASAKRPTGSSKPWNRSDSSNSSAAPASPS